MNNFRLILDKILTVVWIGILILVLYKVYEYASPIWERILNIDINFVVIGIIIGLFFSMPSVWLLRDYFHRFNKNNSWSIAFFLMFLPALGKYIPGKVWAVGSFVINAKTIASISVGDSMIFQFYFQIIGIIATTLLVIAGYFMGYEIIFSISFLIIFLIILLFCSGLSVALARTMKKYQIKIRTDRVFHHGLALIGQKILRGISLIVFISAFMEVNSYVVHIMFAFFLAMQIGVLAFFAPAGLGITEGAYIMTLSGVLGTESAITIALLSRVWSMSLDIILGISALLVKKYRLIVLPVGQ